MIIRCFALIEPFSPVKRQFEAIRELGIEYADLTDNHNGGAILRAFAGMVKINRNL